MVLLVIVSAADVIDSILGKETKRQFDCIALNDDVSKATLTAKKTMKRLKYHKYVKSQKSAIVHFSILSLPLNTGTYS